MCELWKKWYGLKRGGAKRSKHARPRSMFEAQEDTNDPETPDLLIQRQFETSDGGRDES